jgi:2-dehydro-3-deoxyphosphooctonate aldolase (KDO 8-P synthase)
MKPIRIGDKTIDQSAPPILIAGPCVIEEEDDTIRLAERIASLEITGQYLFVFKASYAKDNRSSTGSFRGPGIDEGLRILSRVKTEVGCPVLSDVHTPEEAAAAGEVLDIVQVPAFLSRQTSLLEAAGRSGSVVNIKKGQFLSPEGAGLAVEKVRAVGSQGVLLTERGTTFGYHDLVVDFRNLSRMKTFGCPVIFDVTHSLQRPGGLGDRSGGEPQLAPSMARAAAAVPCDGIFIETHPDPANAKSDAASMLPFAELPQLLEQTRRIFALAREMNMSQNKLQQIEGSQT